MGGLEKMVWFEKGPKQISVSESLTSNENSKTIGQAPNHLDLVWFDASAPLSYSETTTERNVSDNVGDIQDMEPLVLQVEGGLNPEIVREKERRLRQEEDKWRKSIETNEKIIIRI